MNRGSYVLLMGLGLVLLLGAAWVYAGRQTSAAPSSTSSVTAGAESDAAQPATGVDPPPAASGYLAQDAGQGSVSVSAVLLTAGSLAQDASLAGLAGQVGTGEVGIAVTFLTHSVNLSGFDLVALSTLRTPKGDIAPLRWVSEADDDHHRSGMLVFPGKDVDLSASGDLTLIMRDIAGIPERALIWRLPQS